MAVVVVAVSVIAARGAEPVPIPIPNPLVQVTTRSGSVVRTTPVPIGGIPVPIDVDQGTTLGLLTPDIDVSVELVALEELPGRPVVPTITVRRNLLAIQRHAPAPPLRIDAEVRVQDAANGLADLLRISYGFETPADGHVPPVVRAKLVGGLQGAFVDPLEAIIESPGYDGPLKFNARATTPALDARFGLSFDALPRRIHFVEDPRADGLDFRYDHQSADADVALDADATLIDRSSGRRMDLAASVERLPERISLASTMTPQRTLVESDLFTTLGKPDIEASLRDTAPDGSIAVDAGLKLSGVPSRMRGEIVKRAGPGGGSDIERVDFRVLDGDEIDAVDFLARNWVGDPGTLPEPELGPDQFVALASRREPGGRTRFRAAGRIEGIRSATFAREGAARDEVDVRTDIGDGMQPLRALVDVDDRGPGADSGAQRLALDTTVAPLPARIHTHFAPPRSDEPMRLLYESEQVIDVDAKARLSRSSGDACGEPQVTCATARIDRLPSRLELELPGAGQTDYAVSHDGGPGRHPDIRTTVDTTPANRTERLYAEVGILRIPRELRARVDATGRGVLRRAEFHACDWNYALERCRDEQQALGEARFTVRSQPDRGGLPARPEAARTFFSLIQRDAALEASGRVGEIRNVAFRQRDHDGDGHADGVFGARLEVGTGGPFDLHVDSAVGARTARVDSHVDTLPRTLSACVRQPAAAPPDPAPDSDPLLAACERTDVLSRDASRPLPATPLSLEYRATESMRVSADVSTTEPDPADGGRPHTRTLSTVVDRIPRSLRADVLLPAAEGDGPARKLEAAYVADSDIRQIDLTLRNGRADGGAAPGNLFARTRVERIPRALSAVLDASGRVMRQVEFHACPLDFVRGVCPAGPADPLGSVDFLVRPRASRGTLPAQPEHVPGYVTLQQRDANFEIAGHVDAIRGVVFRQRDDQPRDGVPDGTLGVDVEAGSGGPFDVNLDTVGRDERFAGRPDAATSLTTRVDRLPTRFSACFRQAADSPYRAPLRADALLEPCEREDVLGRNDDRRLTTTPLSVAYEAREPTRVRTTFSSRGREPADGGREQQTDLDVTVADVPRRMRGDVILPAEARGTRPPRKLEFQYAADAAIGLLDLTLDRRRTDGTPLTDGGLHLRAKVADIPRILSGLVDTAGGVTRAIDAHACDFDFLAERCPGDGTSAQSLGSVELLVRRPGRERGSLPPAPPLAGTFVSMIRRFEREEVRGRIETIRDVSVRQRPGRGGAPAGSTLGVEVAAGTGGRLDAHVDQIVEDDRFAPGEATAATRLDARVRSLPTRFTACFRQPATEPQTAAPPDVLLARCERTDVLGRGAARPLETTPLSFAYVAANPTEVEASLATRARDPQDGGRERKTELTTKLADVPREVRADVIPPAEPGGGNPARKLELAYAASDPINFVDVGLHSARTDGTRAAKGDLYLETRVRDLPSALAATVDAPADGLRSARFDACRFDFAAGRCDGDREAIGDLEVLMRPTQERNGLPPVRAFAGDHASVLQRHARSEVRARLHGLRSLAVEQQRVPGSTSGPLGVEVDSEARGSFQAVVDQVAADDDSRLADTRPEKALVLDADVQRLPSRFRACFRPPHDRVPTRAGGSSELLGPCLRTDVLGRGDGEALPMTPLSFAYEATAPTKVLADLEVTAEDPDDGRRVHRRDVHVDVAAVPESLRADVIPPEDEFPAPARDLELEYSAAAPVDVGVTYEDARTDGTVAPGAIYTVARAQGIPKTLSGRVRIARKLPTAVDFHACSYDPSERRCDGDLGAIGSLEFLMRRRRPRGSLPALPPLQDNHVSIVKRLDDNEVRAAVRDVRSAEFRQRDRDLDGKADGTLGARVRVGHGQSAFQAHVDQVERDPAHPGETTSTRVDTTVDPLPREIVACLRQPAETPPFVPGESEREPLLADCEQAELLDHDESNPLQVTPLSLAYRASGKTQAVADVAARNRDPADGDRRKVTDLHARIADVPESVRADVLTPRTPIPPGPEHPAGVPGRRLDARYTSSSPIDTIDFGLESRRADSHCLDPRQNRSALCLSTTIRHLPNRLDVSYDPDPDPAPGARTVVLDSDRPADGDPRLSVRNLRLRSTTTDTRSRPISLALDAEDLTPRMEALLVQRELDGEPGRDLAAVTFDACPGDGACAGIGRLRFEAGNALVGGILPDVPPLRPAAPNVVHDLAVVKREGARSPRGGFFNASGTIGALKEVSFTQLDRRGRVAANASKRIRAEFGSGGEERLRAYLDLQDASRAGQLVDAVLSHPPAAIGVCIREPLLEGAAPSTDPASPWCDRQPAGSMAIQARLDRPASGGAPDIDVRKLRITAPGDRDVIAGAVGIEDLGERVDVIADTRSSDGPEVRVEGHPVTGDQESDDRTFANVVGRISFDLRNHRPSVACDNGLDDDGDGHTDLADPECGSFLSASESRPPAASYPFASLNPDALEPEDDPRNGPARRRNFVKIISAPGALQLKGSVPDVERVAMVPAPCDPGDGRFPTPSAPGFPPAWIASLRPKYTCLRANAAARQPLGLAVRTRDARGDVLALDDGHIDTVPGGDDGLSATVATSPAALSLSPACRTGNWTAPDFCRPPLLHVFARRADGQGEPTLEGRLALGPQDLVDELRTVNGNGLPLDSLSQRTPFEEPPRQYTSEGGERGLKLKLGTERPNDADRFAARLGMNLGLPDRLTLDAPTLYSCNRVDPSRCDGRAGTGANVNRGTDAKDIFLKVVGLDRTGAPVDTLGRAAIFLHDFDHKSETVIAGPPENEAPPPPGAPPVPPGGTSRTPESPGLTNIGDRSGALIPGHLQAEIYLRNDYRSEREQDPRTDFVQVDGWFNRPLSIALRLNRKACREAIQPVIPPDFSFDYAGPEPECLPTGGENRGGQPVSGTQLALRDAPGSNNLNAPSFRLRAELRKGHHRTTPLDVGDALGCADIADERGGGWGLNLGLLHVCAITPRPSVRWLDLSLNADPDGTGQGDPPARDIEAVVDTKDLDVELRAFESLQQSTDDKLARGARMSSQAGARLEPFDAGLDIGVNVLLAGAAIKYSLQGDLVAGVAGHDNSGLRMSQRGGAIHLHTRSHSMDNGMDRIDADLEGRIRFILELQALFGLFRGDAVDLAAPGHASPPTHFPIAFQNCRLFGDAGPFGLGTDTFNAGGPGMPNDVKAGALLAPTFSDPIPGIAEAPLSLISQVLVPIWCNQGTRNTPIVGVGDPAPTFDEPDRGILHTQRSGPTTSGSPGGGDREPEDIVVGPGQERFECNTVRARDVRIAPGGRLTARPFGARQTMVVDGRPVETTCTGNLALIARNVTVERDGTRGPGVISADAARPTGAGTPRSGTGGGGGHAGAGGASGSGGPGGASYPDRDPDDLAGDPGSAGRAGSGSAAGGLGGGVLNITAQDTVRLDGVASADGGRGAAASGGCGATGSGGGSGGAVQVTGNRVHVGTDGRLSANGGTGGPGGHGGGGGGGGRVAVNGIFRSVPSAAAGAAPGGTGPAEAGCTDGLPGTAGRANLGTELGLAAEVTRRPPAAPFVREPAVLHTRALSSIPGRALYSLICWRRIPLEGGSLTSARLNPPTVAETRLLVGPDNCLVAGRDFAGSDTYIEHDLTLPASMPEGYYGFYGIAAQPLGSAEGAGCAAEPFRCFFQPLPPRRATVRFAIDRTPPSISGLRASGTPGCPGSSLCVAPGEATLNYDAGSGVASYACSVNGSTFNRDCPPGSVHPIDLSTAGSVTDGLKRVRLRVTDLAGNAVTSDEIRWFIDETSPATPEIEVTPVGPLRNGWYAERPRVVVRSTDPAPSSGFTSEPVTVKVDGDERRCGAAVTPAADAAATAVCTAEETAAMLPPDGEHVVSARARGRSGLPSRESPETVIRYDTSPPTSQLLPGPIEPDGRAGWYRTQPALTFAAEDGPGGSGVDLTGSREPSGVFVRIDGGAPRLYRESDDDRNVLGDGHHRVCWTAVDLVGNAEASRPCRSLEVDSTPPIAGVELDPPTATGGRGWFLDRPVLRARAEDGAGGSGVATVRWSLDGGTFEPYDAASPPSIPPGVHEVCVTATDVAGSAADPACREVRVDTRAPGDAQIHLAPASPNGANGWHRSPVTFSPAAADEPGGSGLDALFVTVDGGPERLHDPGDRAASTLGDGEHRVCWRVVDVAGNSNRSTPPCQRVAVDTTAPTIGIDLEPSAPDGRNGWYVREPRVRLTGLTDAGGSGMDRATAPSGTFLSIDGRPFQPVDPAASTTVPDGDHELCAYAVDVAGNVGSAAGPGAPVCRRVRVDTRGPRRAQIHLDPEQPDGEAGWYRSRPAFVLAASDAPDGSGVDATGAVPPSGLFVAVGGGAARRFDDAVLERLNDGVHEVCTFARDVAGNDGPRDCGTVKVDSSRPLAFDPVTPAQPDGERSFYRVLPVVAPAGEDVPGGSGLDRVERALDDGPWTAGAPITVPEGHHVVRVRALDVAGNASPVLERTVRADVSPPSARVGAYPPAANEQGWRRREPSVQVAVRDGRDGSGPAGAEVEVDGAPPFEYRGAFGLREGTRALRVVPRDLAGLRGTALRQESRVDLTPPMPRPADGPTRLVAGVDPSIPLGFEVGDALSPRVKVHVEVFNVLGTVVRELPVPGPHAGGFRDAGRGSVPWDGRDGSGRGVAPGLYHFRVVARDQAGNHASSTESRQILVVSLALLSP